jgi:hypothetical protein
MSDEELLRNKARAVILSGKLPSRPPDRTFSGPASRMFCAVCGKLMTPDQTQMELVFNREEAPPSIDRHFLHVRCFAAWEFERTAL